MLAFKTTSNQMSKITSSRNTAFCKWKGLEPHRGASGELRSAGTVEMYRGPRRGAEWAAAAAHDERVRVQARRRSGAAWFVKVRYLLL